MKRFTCLLLITFAVLQAGCSQFWLASSSQKNVSSSLVNYLYPDGMKTPVVQTTPLLQLPLRVGIAFVPGSGPQADSLDAATRQRLLATVADHFKQREYISDIEVIPDAYLAGGKGFDTLERVAGLYGLDIIALVSYDQQSFTADTNASFWYWTIVGAYVVEGSKNDVSTFVDTAVFDIPTRSLLMRAPGTSQLSGKSTAVDVAENLAENRVHGFEGAMQEMTANLSVELDQLQARVEAGEASEVQIAHRPGYTGGGGGSGDLFLLGGLLLAGLLRGRQRRQ
ncbi:MAG: rhombotarget lipoprotein [Gammaproteobacteria bacterium]|nr:rhombotarget lipoprotein [Gammaproteobacteria bacterium]